MDSNDEDWPLAVASLATSPLVRTLLGEDGYRLIECAL